MKDSKLADSMNHFDAYETVTIVFTDSNYLPILWNWLEYAAPYLKNNLMIIALDQESYLELKGSGFLTHLLNWDGVLERLWIERVRLLGELLGMGYDIIHSDVDAVWLGDAVSYCRNLDVDGAFSQGTIWPPEVHEKLGVVVCCGFFYLRSNPQTINLLAEWQAAVSIDGDDQRAVNELLFSKGLKWDGEENYLLNWHGKQFRCFYELQISKLENNLKLGLLPHSLFQRVNENRQAILKHPLSEKTGASTEAVLKENNCWSLT